jgi:hypothetical protein
MLEGNQVVLELLTLENEHHEKVKLIGNNQEETANHITLSDILSISRVLYELTHWYWRY